MIDSPSTLFEAQDTKIPALKVAARSSAFRFRGREGEPREIGRELGVGSVLTGRLMQRGDLLRNDWRFKDLLKRIAFPG